MGSASYVPAAALACHRLLRVTLSDMTGLEAVVAGGSRRICKRYSSYIARREVQGHTVPVAATTSLRSAGAPTFSSSRSTSPSGFAAPGSNRAPP